MTERDKESEFVLGKVCYFVTETLEYIRVWDWLMDCSGLESFLKQPFYYNQPPSPASIDPPPIKTHFVAPATLPYFFWREATSTDQFVRPFRQ